MSMAGELQRTTECVSVHLLIHAVMWKAWLEDTGTLFLRNRTTAT